MSKELKIEYWYDVPEYEGKYELSSYGNIAALNYMRTGKRKLITLKKTQFGHIQVRLFKNGIPHNFLVHRLVYETIKGKIPKGFVIDHINGIPNDNNIDNLRCVTQMENIHNPNTFPKQLDGIQKTNCKPVIQYDMLGNVIAEWHSAREACLNLGLQPSSLCNVLKGKSKTCGGFKWKYK